MNVKRHFPRLCLAVWLVALNTLTWAAPVKEEAKQEELLLELDKLLQQDPELASDPALLQMVREDLKRYERGELRSAVLWDPVASELEMVEQLQKEGLSREEARRVSRQFHALREDIIHLYGQARSEGRAEGQQFRKQIEERLATYRRQDQKRRLESQEESQKRAEERSEQRSEGVQKD